MRHIRMNIHGLRKLTDMYRAGHLVTAAFVQQYCACKILSFSYSSGQSVPFDESYQLARAIDLFLKIDGVTVGGWLVGHLRVKGPWARIY
jgi:hypothetical protein